MARRGLTLVELLVVLVVIAILIGIVLPALGMGRTSARMTRDKSKMREVHRGMVLWAQQNQEWFPLPSRFDKDATTVDVGQRADPRNSVLLDSPGHMFSMLAWNGLIRTSLLVSEFEVNEYTLPFEDYMTAEPDGAANPREALWDPALRAHAGDEALSSREERGTTHVSYAVNTPIGARRRVAWKDSSSSESIAFGSRGPAYVSPTSVTSDSWDLLPDSSTINARYDAPVGLNSFSFTMLPTKHRWVGHLAFNDHRVVTADTPAPEFVVHSFSSLPANLRSRPDNLFMNEDDDRRIPLDGDRVGFGSRQNDNVNVLLRSYSRRMTRSAGGEGLDIIPFYD